MNLNYKQVYELCHKKSIKIVSNSKKIFEIMRIYLT